MQDSTSMLLGQSTPSESHLEDEDMPLQPRHPSDPSNAASKDRHKDEELSLQLQELSKIMLNLVNEPDPLSNPYALEYLAETYKSESSIPENTGMKADSSSTHFANVAAFREKNPNYHVDIFDTTAHVNRETGRAMVWCSTRVSGLPTLPAGLTRESVTAMHWKKQAGGFWVLFRTTGIRGPGDHT